jgi:hypothetical protein
MNIFRTSGPLILRKTIVPSYNNKPCFHGGRTFAVCTNCDGILGHYSSIFYYDAKSHKVTCVRCFYECYEREYNCVDHWVRWDV